MARSGQPRVATTTLGVAARYAPGRADLRFALGPDDDRVVTEVTIATLRFADRGVDPRQRARASSAAG